MACGEVSYGNSGQSRQRDTVALQECYARDLIAANTLISRGNYQWCQGKGGTHKFQVDGLSI
jgi:hypothetical protein